LPTLITAAAANSSSVVIDPVGKYVYTITATSSTASIYGFSRDSATGTVTPLAGFPVAIAGLANKAEFDRAGKFLLVTGTNEFGTKGGIEIFSFDSSSGSLTLAAGPVQVGTDPAGAALDSSGKYAYVPNTADASISAFALDGSSGALTAVAGSPFASGGNGNINGPLGIAASSAGAYLYVCNASNDVSVFSINSGTGSLSAIQGSPFPDGGSGPSAIVFVP
jgi:DNA-binding beta-propeller fold protein YncE